nr:aspartate dehydrogenase [Methanocaldococcus villosus]
MRVGIVGCGAIGCFLVRKAKEKVLKADIVALYDRNIEKAEKLAELVGAKVCNSLDELVSEDLDLIVEAASVEAVEEVAEKALKSRKDVLIMSVGAFADKNVFLKLKRLAKENNRNIYIPSGAIGGLDIVKSLKYGEIEELILKTTKHPKALGLDINEKKKVFEGDVFEAIKRFPQNINISVTLSLASKKVAKVIIIADPNVKENIHEIFIKSSIGECYIKINNVPLEENPKTSALAAYSAVRLINEIKEVVKIG